MRFDTKPRWLVRSSAALSLVAMAAFARSAEAHFVLNMPAPSNAADTTGGKGNPPCGPDAASNVVTTVTAGSAIPINITETVGHPGHYRFALGMTRAAIPADPMVTVDANGNSTGAAIMNPAVFPVLADNVFPHTTQQSGVSWVMSLQLPAGMTCTKCTLQVIEYMNAHGSNPGGGYFYHHCADLNIVAGGGTDAGSGTDARTGSGGTTGGNNGQGGATVTGQGGATGTSQGGATGTSQGGATGTTGQGGAPSGGGQGGATGTSGQGGSTGGPGGSGSGNVDAGTLPVTKASGGCTVAAGAPGAIGLAVATLLIVGLVLRRRRR